MVAEAGMDRHLRDTPLTDHESEAIDAYLGDRRQGGGSLDNFWRVRVEDLDRIRNELRLEPGRPLVVMFCNILWDSAVMGRDLAFPSMGTWVTEGIRWAETHPEIDLVVRIHPARVQARAAIRRASTWRTTSAARSGHRSRPMS